MKKRRLSQNEEAIRGILLIIAFIVELVFLRDISVKKGSKYFDADKRRLHECS